MCFDIINLLYALLEICVMSPNVTAQIHRDSPHAGGCHAVFLDCDWLIILNESGVSERGTAGN